MSLHSVLPPASDAKFIGDEPSWNTDAVSDKTYNIQLIEALNWHNYCATEKDYVKYVEAWIKLHRPKTFKQDVVLWRSYNKLDKTLCALARIHMQGFPLTETHVTRLNDYVTRATTPVKKTRATPTPNTPAVNRPTIQDRIRQQVSGVLSNLDVRIDEAFDGSMAPADTIKADILAQSFKGPQLKLVQNYLDKNLIEWIQTYSGEDEQLAQGYKYVGKRNLKKIIDTFTAVFDAISEQSTRIKTQRMRKRTPLDKKKMVSKIRYMKEFEGIQSKNPVDIIGANCVWIYDTKKRRLGYYEAEVKDSLYVKGNKIFGFKNTCEKILRKPEEQLSQVTALRKNQTVNWFDTIKAKCKTMTGRMNDSLIILRID